MDENPTDIKMDIAGMRIGKPNSSCFSRSLWTLNYNFWFPEYAIPPKAWILAIGSTRLFEEKETEGTFGGQCDTEVEVTMSAFLQISN